MLLEKSAIRDFCDKNGIKNVAGFLRFIVRGNTKKLTDFLNQQGLQLLPRKDGFLLHGSRKLSKKLEPTISTGGGSAGHHKSTIYATDDQNYAIFLAIINVQKEGTASVLVKNGRAYLEIDIGFVNGPSTLGEGFVHVVGRSGFKETGNSEYANTLPVEVLFAIKVNPSDLTEPIIVKITS